MIVHILSNYNRMRNNVHGGGKPTYSRQQVRAMLVILAIVGSFLFGEIPLIIRVRFHARYSLFLHSFLSQGLTVV